MLRPAGGSESAQGPAGLLAVISERVIDAETLEQAMAAEMEVLEFKRLNAEAVYFFNLRNLQSETLRKLLDDQVVRAEVAKGGRTEQEVRATLEASGGRSQLWRANGVQILWQPRASIEIDGAPALGPSGAVVTVVEFGDFTCGFCARFAPVLRQAHGRYGENVRFVFRHNPLAVSGHNAFRAAQVAACAQDQGKFWEVHDLLFRERDQLIAEGVDSLIPDLPVDTAQLRACLASPSSVKRVKHEQELAARAGAPGTPAVFVNGILRGGNQGPEGLSALIDEELARLGVAAPATSVPVGN